MSRALRDAFGCFATGVTLVTTHWNGQDWGMTCSSFNAVSLDPALVLWNIRHSSASHEAFVRGGGEPALIRYNSRLPLVVYAPTDVEVRYRIWSAGAEQRAPH